MVRRNYDTGNLHNKRCKDIYLQWLQGDKDRGDSGDGTQLWCMDNQFTGDGIRTGAAASASCAVCGTKETRTGEGLLTPTIQVNAQKLLLKVKQKTTAFKVTGLAAGDSVVSYTSSNTKVFTVSKNGALTAGKKPGKATLTITLASGLEKKIPVTVQKGTVTTTKITGLKKKVTLEKGKKLTLKPALTPITSQQKFTYTSSNKKVATVSKKGVITAKKSGTAKITVKSGKKKFVVTVTVPKTKTEKDHRRTGDDQPEEGENLYLKGKTFPEGKRGEADLQLFKQKDRNCKQER